jgi:TP901 family phage tail tape measure protein
MPLSSREMYLVIRARDEASRVLRGFASTLTKAQLEQAASQANINRLQLENARISKAQADASLKRAVASGNAQRIESALARTRIAENNVQMRQLQQQMAQQHQLEQERRASGQRMQALGSSLVSVGASMGIVGAVGLAFFGKATKDAIEYNREAALTKTQTDAAGASVQRLANIGRNTARDIAVPFEQMQGSMYDIFSSMDVNVPQMTHLLRNFSKTAVAGQVDLQDASRATIGIMNAYHMKANQVNMVNDVMFQLVRKGVGTYGQFATTIGRAVPSASRAGQSIQTLAGMLAFLTRNGLSAAMASSSAARAIDALNNPTARKNLKDFGVDVLDAQNNMRPVPAIIEDISKKLEGMTRAQKSAKLTDIFKGAGGTIQARRFLDPAVNNFRALNELTQDMVGSTGQLNRAYKQMSNTPAAQAQLLSNRYHALMTEIGDNLIPIFLKLVTAVGGVVKWFDQLSPGMKQTLVVVLALSSAAMVLVGIVIAMAGGFLMMAGAAAAADVALIPMIATMAGLLLGAAAVIAILVLLGAGFYNAHQQAAAFNDGLNKLAHTNDWTVAQKQMQTTQNRLDDLSNSWTDALNLSGDKARQWADLANHVSNNVRELGVTFGVSSSAAYMLAKAAGTNLTGSFDSVMKSVSGYRNEIDIASGGNKTMEYDMIVMASYVNTAKDKFQALNDALDYLIGINVNVDQALVNMKNTMVGAKKEIEKHTLSWNLNTQAGRDNRSMMDGVISSAKNYASALGQQVLKTTHDTNRATETMTKAFWDQIDAFIHSKGVTDDQRKAMEAYLKKLGLVPPKKETDILTPGLASAAQGVWDLVHGLNQIPGHVSTSVFIKEVLSGTTIPKNQQSTKTLGGGLAGLAGHRALGGDVTASSAYLVGENGPEIFVAPTNGRVLDATHTRDAIRSAKTGHRTMAQIHQAHLDKLAAERAAAARKAAQEKRKAIYEAHSSFVSGMQSQQQGFTDLSSQFSGSISVDTASAVRWLRQRVQQFKTWTGVIRKLARRGLNRFTLRDLINAGPDTIALAQSLLSGNAIDEVNKAMRSVAKTEASFDDFAYGVEQPKQAAQYRKQRAADRRAREHDHRKHAGGNTVNFTQNINVREADPRKLAADAGYELQRYL